jgi:hypothetical protein
MTIPVYVPADDDRHLRNVIDPGSGIVGRRPFHRDVPGLLLFYEGALKGSGRKFARKVADACERLKMRYPTIGTVCVEPERVLQVGTYDEKTRTVQVTDAERLARWLGISRGADIPAHQLADYLAPVIPIKDPREVQRERYAVNRGPVPPLPPQPDIRIEMGPTVDKATTLAEKLNPRRFPNMDSKLAAVVRYILEERFTSAAGWDTDDGTRKIAELALRNGEVLKRDEGEFDFQSFYAESDLVANWKRLLDGAGLTAIERTMAQESFYKRVVTGGRRSSTKPSERPKEPPPEKPKEPYKFYRKVNQHDLAMFEETRSRHPALTLDDFLEMLEAFGG